MPGLLVGLLSPLICFIFLLRGVRRHPGRPRLLCFPPAALLMLAPSLSLPCLEQMSVK